VGSLRLGAGQGNSPYIDICELLWRRWAVACCVCPSCLSCHAVLTPAMVSGRAHVSHGGHPFQHCVGECRQQWGLHLFRSALTWVIKHMAACAWGAMVLLCRHLSVHLLHCAKFELQQLP
jgi:hypothetical protein